MKDSSAPVQTAGDALGGIIGFLHEQKQERFAQEILEIFRSEESKKIDAKQCFYWAQKQIEGVRDFLNSPNNILGNIQTKHGEIAEQTEVAFRNAGRIIWGQRPDAHIDDIPRTGPVDFNIAGWDIQSKYINSAAKSLQHCMEHLRKYPDFLNGRALYMIPQDQYEHILSVLDRPLSLLNRTETHLYEQIKAIEKELGKPFSSVFVPGSTTYAEVQIGAIDGTLSAKERELLDIHNRQLKDIQEQSKSEIQAAKDRVAPHLSEAVGAAVLGAALEGSMEFGFAFYQKKKQKARMDEKDWQEIGQRTKKGAIHGGINGAAMYALTNYAHCPTPVLSSVTAAGFGVASLVAQYHRGEITPSELMEQGSLVCGESALVAVSACIGQAVVPLPVVGTMVGAAAGRILIKYLHTYHDLYEQKEIQQLMAEWAVLDDKANQAILKTVQEIDAYLDKQSDILEQIADASKSYMERFWLSVSYCEEHGGTPIRTMTELDQYIKS